MIDWARRFRELMLKKVLHIQMTPAEKWFNRDGGLELPGCWIAALKTLGGGAGHRQLPALLVSSIIRICMLIVIEFLMCFHKTRASRILVTSIIIGCISETMMASTIRYMDAARPIWCTYKINSKYVLQKVTTFVYYARQSQVIILLMRLLYIHRTINHSIVL